MGIKLTKTQKNQLIEMFEMVDVKRLEIEVDDPSKVKWFRFGSYNGMQIATEIIKAIDEKSTKKNVGIVD